MGPLKAVLMAALVACAVPAAAQDTADATLASRITQRFDVLPVQGGVVLTPKASGSGVRSVELTNGTIAIDGTVVTGAELKQRLPADADLIVRLSYLAPADQRALFGSPQRGATPPPAPAEPAAPAPPAAADPAQPAPPASAEPPRRRDRSGDRVRIGGDVEVRADEIVDGDVVSIGGNVKVDGEVDGDTVAIGGNLDLGPNANVHGDAVVVGGALHRSAGAQVEGEVNEVGFGEMNFGPGWWRRFGDPRAFAIGNPFGSIFALVSTATRLAVLCILASVVLLFGRGYVERVSLRAATEPVKAGAVGLLIQLLFVPVLVATIVLMVITIVGIPLLVLVPFAILAFAVLFLVGFTAVVYDIGRLAAARFGWDSLNPYLVASVGIALVLSPVLLSRLIGFGGVLLSPITWTLLLLGFLVEYLTWTVGLGAVALVRFDRR